MVVSSFSLCPPPPPCPRHLSTSLLHLLPPHKTPHCYLMLQQAQPLSFTQVLKRPTAPFLPHRVRPAASHQHPQLASILPLYSQDRQKQAFLPHRVGRMRPAAAHQHTQLASILTLYSRYKQKQAFLPHRVGLSETCCSSPVPTAREHPPIVLTRQTETSFSPSQGGAQ